MTRFTIAVALLLLALMPQKSQALALDSLFLSCTAYIENNSSRAAGTGFLVRRQVDEKGSTVYLVSNRHVLMPADVNSNAPNKTANATIVINVGPPEQRTRHTFTITMREANGILKVKPHPNDAIDVAAVDVSKYFGQHQELRIAPIPEDYLMTKSNMISGFVSIGDPIVVLGYPLSIVENGHVIPVARSGIIATSPEMDFHGLPVFLIDSQIVRGSSGSPVITPSHTGKWININTIDNSAVEQCHVIGIVSGVVKD